MNLFASTCFILLSSDTGFVFGSNIRGSALGSDHGDQYIMGNFALRSEDVPSEETSDDTPRALFKEAEFEEYNLLDHSYTQLSGEINDALLKGNNGMDGGESARTRQAFISFLKEGNSVPGIPVDTDLPSEESKDEQERDGTFIVGNVSFQEAMGESISEGGMQLIRGNGGTSYHKNQDKGCRNYYGKKGSNHHDYDLIEGYSKRECKIKCNDLGDHCYGYEYSSHHQRCEIWKVSIEHVQYVHGFDCYIKNKSTPYPTKKPTPYPTKKPTPYPTKKPTPYPKKKPTPYPTKKPTAYPTEYATEYMSYQKERNKGCRNHYGKKGSNHHDYDLIEHCSKSECRTRCTDLIDNCYGFEYSSNQQRCEIWKVSIDHVEYVHGFDCYIKNW